MNIFKNVDKGTIIRTAVLVLAFINSGLALFGKSPLPINDQDLTNIISYGFTLVAAFVSWWEDNAFTKAAIAGKKVTKAIKQHKATCAQVEKILDK